MYAVVLQTQSAEDRKRKIQAAFSGKRYLLVLDDVWKPTVISCGFPEPGLGSKHLVTSRVRDLWTNAAEVHFDQDANEAQALAMLASYASGDAKDTKIPAGCEVRTPSSAQEGCSGLLCTTA
jgi:NB-ARC domain